MASGTFKRCKEKVRDYSSAEVLLNNNVLNSGCSVVLTPIVITLICVYKQTNNVSKIKIIYTSAFELVVATIPFLRFSQSAVT